MTPAEREKLFQERKAKYGHILEPFPKLTEEQLAEMCEKAVAAVEPEPIHEMPEVVELTLVEYTSPERFPVTSLPRYAGDPGTQLRMDAFNLDQLNEGLELGEMFNDRQRAALAELQEKQPHMQRLMQELRDQEKAAGK